MATTLASGETMQVLMSLGMPVNEFTLGTSTLNGTDVLDGELVGEDITAYVQQVSADRGRSDQFASYRAGVASIILLNNDRRFDPLNSDSPYWDNTAGRSGVQPRRKVEITLQGEHIFTGRITDIDLDYNQRLSTVMVTAADDFVLLANAAVANVTTPPAQLSGARVSFLLDLPEINYPALSRSIDAGVASLGAYPIGENTNALQYLQQVSESEQGVCFVTRDGLLRFADRIPDGEVVTTAAGSFSDDLSGIPYQTLKVTYTQQNLYNRVQAANVGGVVQTVDDLVSQAEYGTSTLPLTDLLLATDGAAQVLAADQLSKYSEPRYQFDDMSVSVSSLVAGDRAAINAIEIGDILQITKTFDSGAPLQVTENYTVNSIRHTVTPSSHECLFGMSYFRVLYQFILSDAVFGVLDADNALG